MSKHTLNMSKLSSITVARLFSEYGAEDTGKWSFMSNVHRKSVKDFIIFLFGTFLILGEIQLILAEQSWQSFWFIQSSIQMLQHSSGNFVKDSNSDIGLPWLNHLFMVNRKHWDWSNWRTWLDPGTRLPCNLELWTWKIKNVYQNYSKQVMISTTKGDQIEKLKLHYGKPYNRVVWG